jgi:hypothetical protein
MGIFICVHLVRQESYAMNCHRATPSFWGNLTRMCFCSNAEVQSSWDNVKKSENKRNRIDTLKPKGTKAEFKTAARNKGLWDA